MATFHYDGKEYTGKSRKVTAESLDFAYMLLSCYDAESEERAQEIADLLAWLDKEIIKRKGQEMESWGWKGEKGVWMTYEEAVSLLSVLDHYKRGEWNDKRTEDIERIIKRIKKEEVTA